jgi:hypothetical protein
MFEGAFDVSNFFIFVIPGFITVWSFRFFRDSKKIGEFEYFVASVFWGLITLLFFEYLPTQDEKKLLQNPYAAAAILSFFGLLLGWIGSVVAKIKFFQKIVVWLKEFHF